MTENRTETVTELVLSDEDNFIVDGATSVEPGYKILISSFTDKFCFYGALIPLDMKKRLAYIGIKVRSLEKTQLVTGYKCLVGGIDLLFLECVCDENNKILEILFVKEEWFEGT